MIYASADDLVARFGQAELSQFGRSSPAAITDALADASSVIDGYVATRYQLPLAVIPSLLIKVCCDLARSYLYKDSAPDTVASARDQALRHLRDIGSGDLSLDVGSTDTLSLRIISRHQPMAFTPRNMAGW